MTLDGNKQDSGKLWKRKERVGEGASIVLLMRLRDYDAVRPYIPCGQFDHASKGLNVWQRRKIFVPDC